MLLACERAAEYFSLSRADEQEKSKEEPKARILIKSGGVEHRLPTDEVLYIESDGEYLKYHTRQTRYMVLGSLRRQVLALGPDFVQVHRSYAVNRQHVHSKTRQTVELEGKRIIPIGKNYRQAFQFVSKDVVF